MYISREAERHTHPHPHPHPQSAPSVPLYFQQFISPTGISKDGMCADKLQVLGLHVLEGVNHKRSSKPVPGVRGQG